MASVDSTARPTGPHEAMVQLHAGGPASSTPGNRSDPPRPHPSVVLAGLLDTPPAVELTSSCTHALEAAALVLGIGPSDEVIVPAFTFPSTANAFLLRGATIRFADVDPHTGNIDPADVARLINPATRAVVCTHYAGVPCDMAALGALCDRHGLDLVEDAAHGLFGSWNGRPLGTFGRLGALSFHRTKNISAIEGGALIVNDPDLVPAVHVAIDKGTNRAEFEAMRVRSYEWAGPGSAWRMPDPSVSILADELGRRHQIQAVRHRVWARYRSELEPWAEQTGARLPFLPDACEHPAHLFWIVLPADRDRERFVERCAELGVQVARHYGSLPASRFGARIRHPDDRCPVAAELGERLVRLPIHQDMSERDVDRVVSAVLRATV
jgi:dTDP-4-amino-4,6-dideoxygalactose transaminase